MIHITSISNERVEITVLNTVKNKNEVLSKLCFTKLNNFYERFHKRLQTHLRTAWMSVWLLNILINLREKVLLHNILQVQWVHYQVPPYS